MGEYVAGEGCRCVLIDRDGESSPSNAEIPGAIGQRRDVKRVLVALGGAPAGETKLPVAEMLARAFDADLLFLHVLTRTAATAADPVSPNEARACAYLETVAARLHADGLHAHGVVRTAASVTEGIVAAARELDADLIVLGPDGPGGVARACRQNRAAEVARP